MRLLYPDKEFSAALRDANFISERLAQVRRDRRHCRIGSLVALALNIGLLAGG